MDYKSYKLVFEGAVHFGSRSLENGNYTFCADTLFSALCQEALKMGADTLLQFYHYAKNGQLLFSDAFPYIGSNYYIPKPVMNVHSDHTKGDSVLKKAYKKLKYVPIDAIDEYLAGRYDVLHAPDMAVLGESVMNVSVSLRGEEEPNPYRIHTFYYNKDNGLYCIIGYENENILTLAEELFIRLSYNGIGGKKASGLGRFTFVQGDIAPVFYKRLGVMGKRHMSLSVSLPKDHELESALHEAQYIVCRRSGFVDSQCYAKEQRRKKDLYVLQAGSCFYVPFEGDIYDVSGEGGVHPVYRYAKPIFMEVS